jgi:hypothetical protein
MNPTTELTKKPTKPTNHPPAQPPKWLKGTASFLQTKQFHSQPHFLHVI